MENGLNEKYKLNKTDKNIYNSWERSKIFTPKINISLYKRKKIYTIIMPPPNITGILHNGHALFSSLEDVLTRYHRMKGYNTLWLPGIDHAGIATQNIVLKTIKAANKINVKKINKSDLKNKIWQWKEKHGDIIIKQLKFLGSSADWFRSRFTMDKKNSNSVNYAFIKLWNEGLIYRAERIVNWDSILKTAISNEEIEYKINNSKLWKFAYKIKNSSKKEIIVSTTRPETILGDIAVAVNPGDKRYQKIVGKSLIHPFFKKRNMKIIADSQIDKEFGSGAVKITPAHNQNDFNIAKRHKLKFIKVFDYNGHVRSELIRYNGLKTTDARKIIKKDLISLGLFRGYDLIKNNINSSQRSGITVEPIASRQYFVKMHLLAHFILKGTTNQKIKIIPDSWLKVWNYFLRDTRDWCISRQLAWGHRIPVFYNIRLIKDYIKQYIGIKSLSCKSNFQKLTNQAILNIALNELSENIINSFSITSEKTFPSRNCKYIQEKNVLDTWFSAALWPISSLKWPTTTKDFKVFYPTSILETGSDILFFWVSKMLILGYHFTRLFPFKEVFLHSIVRDSNGKKMSKSLGNAIDPIDVINGISQKELMKKTKTYHIHKSILSKILKRLKKDFPNGIASSSVDGLRLSLIILSGQGHSVNLNLSRVTGYKVFLNKIWNATRFVLLLVKRVNKSIYQVFDSISLVNSWILSRIEEVTHNINIYLTHYNFNKAAEEIYHFFWKEFCDWYIEFIKKIFQYKGIYDNKHNSGITILYILNKSIKLIHPFCPFISELIWQRLAKYNLHKKNGIKFCSNASYPTSNKNLINTYSVNLINIIMLGINALRSIRHKYNISPIKKIEAIFSVINKNEQKTIIENKKIIERIAHLSKLHIKIKGQLNSKVYPLYVFNKNINVFVNDKINDLKYNKESLHKAMKKNNKQLLHFKNMINNRDFIKNAPKFIFLKIQSKYKCLKDEKFKLSNIIDTID